MVVRVDNKVTIKDNNGKLIRGEGYAFMCDPKFESVEVMKEKLKKGADIIADALKNLERGDAL